MITYLAGIRESTKPRSFHDDVSRDNVAVFTQYPLLIVLTKINI